MEEYFAKDVASELGLSQTKLIRLAMLLGSDYTEGINGIGGCLETWQSHSHTPRINGTHDVSLPGGWFNTLDAHAAILFTRCR